MEDEFYNLTIKGNDLKTYIRRFQELAVLCLNMVPNYEKLMEVFIGGLPRSIEGNVTASKPQTLEEAINITQRLMDQVTKHIFVQGTNDHKRKFDDRRPFTNNNYQNNRNSNNNRNNDHHQQQNRRQETVRAYAATPTENKGNCKNKGPATRSKLQLVSVTCHACGEKGHYRNQCPKANNSAYRRAYMLRDKNAHQDPNVVTEFPTMNVSPLPTTRINKDHHKDQIIRDFNSAIQTRRMTKISDEHAMMDVKSAFLYGTIKEEVYICQPLCFEDPHFPDKVYKVEKALYGLHQAPRAWYETFPTYLIENGFKRGTIDKTLFIKKDKANDAQEIPDEFYGELTFFLRLQFIQKDDGIFISQDNTPIETNKALLKEAEAEDVDVYLYRSMIGSLMYLIASRPDIMFAVCACARDSPFDLEAFSDCDYACASLDRKSTTGGCQFLGKRLISWQCKKQTIVANSTTEAEYVVAANCYGRTNHCLSHIKPKKTQKPRKTKRTTEISQSSGPIHLDVDETVHKELGDRMEGLATTKVCFYA
ncbi:putative ribonuclease H-like domain-containing protein [Tanacetum coccineum]